MEELLALLPVLAPVWRRWRWKLRRLARSIKDFFIDLAVILIGTGVVVGVWYIGFVIWPKMAH